MNLKRATLYTMVCLVIVLVTDIFCVFGPIALKEVVPNPAHWLGFVFAFSTILRDAALVSFFAFFYKRTS